MGISQVHTYVAYFGRYRHKLLAAIMFVAGLTLSMGIQPAKANEPSHNLTIHVSGLGDNDDLIPVRDNGNLVQSVFWSTADAPVFQEENNDNGFSTSFEWSIASVTVWDSSLTPPGRAPVSIFNQFADTTSSTSEFNTPTLQVEITDDRLYRFVIDVVETITNNSTGQEYVLDGERIVFYQGQPYVVTAAPNPVQVGIGTSYEYHGCASVDPAADVDEVYLDPIDPNCTLAGAWIDSTDEGGGMIYYTVEGANGSTEPWGDAVVSFRDTTSDVGMGSTWAVVLVPYFIGEPHPTPNTTVSAVNMLLNSSTSPAAVGLAPPIVAACTTYGQYLQIQVWDQFYNPLSGVYSGAPVTESLNGQISWIPINQAIQGDGTYEDPVMEIPGPTPLLNPSIPADAAAIAAWPGAAPNAPTNGYSPQSVDVAVAGFVLQDMHGDQAISSREVTFTVIPNVQNQCTYTIVWPN